MIVHPVQRDFTKVYADALAKIDNAALPLGERKRIAVDTLTKAYTSLAEHTAAKADLDAQIDGYKRIQEWTDKTPVLERNDCSRFHQFLEAGREGRVISTVLGRGHLDVTKVADAKVFVVQHDWARAFDGSPDYEVGAAHRIPYPVCVFEFMVSGVCCLVFTAQDDGDCPVRTIFTQTNTGWVCWEDENAPPLAAGQLCAAQIQAISVALEAQIAAHSVVRAPSALNAKRAKQGKCPLYDYHVVSLAHRTRVAPLGTGTHRTPRLHFRRGHWRHYEDHNTWIKWTLVGDPDLGFIDKHYTL